MGSKIISVEEMNRRTDEFVGKVNNHGMTTEIINYGSIGEDGIDSLVCVNDSVYVQVNIWGTYVINPSEKNEYETSDMDEVVNYL